jgi:hypothetical protein
MARREAEIAEVEQRNGFREIEARKESAYDAVWGAEYEVMEAKPATPAGAIALLRFVAELMEGLFPDDDEHEHYVGAIRNAADFFEAGMSKKPEKPKTRECSRARKVGNRSIWRTPDHDRRAPLRRLETSFSQGAKWKALISMYIGTIPFSGDPCPAEQSISIGPPPRTPVISAMIAKVGVAARHSHLAMPSAAAAPSSSQLAAPVELA